MTLIIDVMKIQGYALWPFYVTNNAVIGMTAMRFRTHDLAFQR
jgi:hypothetical protein